MPAHVLSLLAVTDSWMIAQTIANVVAAIAAVIAAGGAIWVAVLARRGLLQISVAKTDIITRSQREALTAAIHQCREFADSLLPELQDLMVGLAGTANPLYSFDPKQSLVFAQPSALELKRADDWIRAIGTDNYTACVRHLNHLEAFALYFTSRLADSETAFKRTSDVFCRTIAQLYPIIIHNRSRYSGYYSSIVQLYEEWSSLRSSEDRQNEARFLQKKMKELQADGPSRVHPKAMGTDIP